MLRSAFQVFADVDGRQTWRDSRHILGALADLQADEGDSRSLENGFWFAISTFRPDSEVRLKDLLAAE